VRIPEWHNARARSGSRVFGMVGASNVANATTEFKPAKA
jgi:hypothetical protein